MQVAIEGKWTDEDMTEWFDPPVKPARQGVYEVESSMHNGQTFWSKWDGKYWRAVDTSYGQAKIQQKTSMEQNRKWRGLCKKP